MRDICDLQYYPIFITLYLSVLLAMMFFLYSSSSSPPHYASFPLLLLPPSSPQGGGQLLITFPEGVPSGSLFLIFSGSSQYHKQAAERVDDHTVTAVLPGDRPLISQVHFVHVLFIHTAVCNIDCCG